MYEADQQQKKIKGKNSHTSCAPPIEDLDLFWGGCLLIKTSVSHQPFPIPPYNHTRVVGYPQNRPLFPLVAWTVAKFSFLLWRYLAPCVGLLFAFEWHFDLFLSLCLRDSNQCFEVQLFSVLDYSSFLLDFVLMIGLQPLGGVLSVCN